MRDMQILRYAVVFALVVLTIPAQAAVPEAREIARMNNCLPKKVEVYQQKMGRAQETTYRVECIAPKIVNQEAPKLASAMLVRCDGAICEMLRPLDQTTK